ncbi:MAG: penicillin-binding protein 2 [Phycisphaerales bacterium]|nr:penicillin-binding protein 2 [Phycisphaerales bacterium]
MTTYRRSDVALTALVVGVSVALVVMLGRVVQLQVAPGENLSRFVEDRVSRRAEMAPRGDLLDRRGRVLSATRTGERLFVDPSKFKPPFDEAFDRIVRTVGLDRADAGMRLYTALARNEARAAQGLEPLRYVRLSGVLSDDQAEAARGLKIAGVHLETWTVRDGPGEYLAGAIVGRVNIDNQGQFGAERMHDAILGGDNGVIAYVRDARGKPLWVQAGAYQPPRAGEPVRLSIDLAIQDIAEEELERAVADADAAGGRIVVLDPATGEILAMLDIVRNLGSRAVPWGVKPRGNVWRRTIIPPDPNRGVHPGAGRNRCVTDVYEPGSTFKAFTWAVISDAGAVRLDETLRTGGKSWITPYGRPIRDVFGKDSQTWRDVLINSSNIGMSQAAERVSHDTLREGLVKFGFGQRTGLGLPGEREGYLPPKRSWSKYTHTSVSFGQEVGVTAVQLATAFGAFARQGELAGALPTARLTALPPGKAPDEIVRRVLPWSVATQARLAMARIFEKLDSNMQIKGTDATFEYALFGKTGTGQVSLPGERGYLPNQYVSSFIGAGPVEAPRLVCLVVIDDPGPALVARAEHRGSAVAAPAVRRVLERSLSYLGVPPSPKAEGAVAGAQ